MPELSQRERLQPSLLDRLTDDEPGKQKESREQRVLSLRKLRECVIRDLAWLMNCVNLGEIQDLEKYPYAARSVINYGMPDLTGHTISSVDIPTIEAMLRQAIWDFEPRILKNTVRIIAEVNEDEMSQNTVTFEIEGELWAQPVPVHLYLKTELDLEDGHISVMDQAARALT
jgi:type VI secretion system protein ImpF